MPEPYGSLGGLVPTPAGVSAFAGGPSGALSEHKRRVLKSHKEWMALRMPRVKRNMNKEFRYYMHDGPDAISFELAGHLSGPAARELEQARRTASSTAHGRSLIVDLSYLTGADSEGRATLRGWYADGAQLVAKVPLAKTILESITRDRAAPVTQTARSQTWRPVLLASSLVMVSLFAPSRTLAAELSPETVQVWERYVKTVDARNQTHPTHSRSSRLSLRGKAVRRKHPDGDGSGGNKIGEGHPDPHQGARHFLVAES